LKVFCFLFVFIFFIIDAQAVLKSNIKSSVEGIDIPNAHIIASTPKSAIIRGMEPYEDLHYKQLLDFGVKHILVFKQESQNEVDKELKKLFEIGFLKADMSNFHHISFKWKDQLDFSVSCLKTLKALSIIIKAYKDDESLFFHCTSGEDRTGYLAALFRYLQKPRITPQHLFQTEMCARAYGAANKMKSNAVIQSIRKELTPVFMKMMFLIKNDLIAYDNLDINACAYDFNSSKEFGKSEFINPELFYCE